MALAAMWKSTEVTSSSTMLTPTSSAASELSDACSLPRIMISTMRPSEPAAERMRSTSGSVGLTAIAMTTSAQASRATSTGRLRVMPPSTSSQSPTSTGAKAPGTDMLARSAVGRSPERNTTIWPDLRSVATARKGIGNRSKSSTPVCEATMLRSRDSTCWVSTSPRGAISPCSPSPNSSLFDTA